MSVNVEVWGDWACFSRPELKVERVSYDVITPSAARGLIEAIYWHPGMRWLIDKIHVLNPVNFSNVRRNEVKSKVTGSSIKTLLGGGKAKDYIATSEDIQQRAALVLRDVHYVIEAHFELTGQASPSDNEGKFQDIIKRRLKRGQCYHQPCFGTREFPAYFRLWEGGKIVTAYPEETRDLGLMLFDMDFSDPENIVPLFFRAKLEHGVLQVPAPNSKEVLR